MYTETIYIPCKYCHGTGLWDNGHQQYCCSYCHGRGYIELICERDK